MEGATTGSVLVGTFTDANPFGLTTDFTVSIKWGDGTTSAGTVSQPGGIGTVFLVDGDSHLHRGGSLRGHRHGDR